MSTRRTLMLGILGLALLALAIAGTAMIFLLRGELLDDVDSRLEQRAEVASSFPFLRALPPVATPLGSEFRPFASDTAVLFFDESDREVGSIPSGPSEDPDPLPEVDGLVAEATVDGSNRFTTIDAADGGPRYRVLVVPIADGGGTVVVAAPLTDLDDTIRSAVVILLIIGGLTAIVLTVVVLGVVRAAMRPIDDLIETAGTIGGGDLSVRTEVASDRTEVGKLGGALNEMMERIETAAERRASSEERLRRFASDASHELRTPLTIIRGYAELHGKGAMEGPEVDEAMRRIADEAERMSIMVDDLLLLARLDQARPVAREVVDVGDLAEVAVEGARVASPERRWTLTRTDAELLVDGTPDLLRRALDNVLANVAEHTAERGAAAVSVGRLADAVVVEVADEGPGMDPADADRVFDRFHRAGDGGENGAGLGLAIVQQIAHAHGGTVTLDSSASGTVVRLALPAAPGRPADSAETLG